MHVHWQGSEHRSVVPSWDGRAHWRMHFASATSSFSSHYCDDFSPPFPAASRHSRVTSAMTGLTLHSPTTNWSQHFPGVTIPRQVLTRCTSRGGDICFSLFSTLFSNGPSSHPLGNQVLWSQSSNGMAILHPKILVGLSLSPLAHSRFSTTHIFPHWTSAKAVSAMRFASSPVPHSHCRRIRRRQEGIRFVLGGGHPVAFTRCWCVWTHETHDSQLRLRHAHSGSHWRVIVPTLGRFRHRTGPSALASTL